MKATKQHRWTNYHRTLIDCRHYANFYVYDQDLCGAANP